MHHPRNQQLDATAAGHINTASSSTTIAATTRAGVQGVVGASACAIANARSSSVGRPREQSV